MRFEKWQALGNDYAILEAGSLPFELTEGRVRQLCSHHTGIGSDGILLISETEGAQGPVARVRIFNPDGSEAELSGNGVRQAILYLRANGWADSDEFSVDTIAGEVRACVKGPTSCAVGMGVAQLRSESYPSGGGDGRGSVTVDGREFAFQHVLVGNPQCAIEVEDGLEDLDLARYGPAIERHELFPNRTNVSFWRRESDTEITARIFERGVGETLASGTGAAGAAVAAVLGGAGSPVTVHLDGGDLEVEVGPELQLTLTGPASPVFAGTLADELVRGLREP